jgi:hypothetical protein
LRRLSGATCPSDRPARRIESRQRARISSASSLARRQTTASVNLPDDRSVRCRGGPSPRRRVPPSEPAQPLREPPLRSPSRPNPRCARRDPSTVSVLPRISQARTKRHIGQVGTPSRSISAAS